MRKKLTARFVETVTTDRPRIEFFDADEDGLMLRVTKDGTRTWAFRYRRKSDGKRQFITLGRFPELRLEQARNAAATARLSASQGGDPASGVQVRKAAPTFIEVVSEWQANHAASNRSDHVRANDQSILNRYVLPSIGAMKVHDVGRRELSAMLTSVRVAKDGRAKRDSGDKPRRLSHQPNRTFELTRAILRWALENGIIEVDPTLGMKRPVKKEAARERALSSDEIATFWKNVNQLPTPALQIALKLSLVTGQRIGEVCGIAMSELVLDGPAPVWVLPRERAKNDESSRVPLSQLAMSLIRAALEIQKPREGGGDKIGSPYLFPARAKRDKSHGPILLEIAAGMRRLAEHLAPQENTALSPGDDVTRRPAGLRVENATAARAARSMTGREDGDAISSSEVMRPASGADAPPKVLKASSTKAFMTRPAFMSATPGP